MRTWLKEARLKKGYTMAQLAEKLDITESYYCSIEAGTRQKRMDMALAAKLSCLLGLSLNKIAKNEQTIQST